MCGFIGIAAIKQRPAVDVQVLNNILEHRGPDAVAHYQDAKCLLVHRRLSIIDLSQQANQPFVSKASGNVLVFNGEIYNYKELKKKYAQISWTTDSDTEVVLKLYELNGPAFVQELNGIFAFAIYDRQQQKIYAYRDRLGVKPFYWQLEEGVFYFASEIKGILQWRGRYTFNYQSLYAYLDFGLLEHNASTLFAGVEKIDAGTYLTFDLTTGERYQHEYWALGYQEADGRSDAQYAAQTHALLLDAVKKNLVSDVEIGLSLSSGLDSTLLYLLLKETGANDLRCFTYGFEDERYDEVRCVRNNPYLTDARLHPVMIRSQDMLGSLDKALHYFEAPLGGLGTLGVYQMMAEVKKAGIKVMLAGEGADEIFGGYKYYYPGYFRDIAHEESLLASEVDCYNKSHGASDDYRSAAFKQRLQAVALTHGVMAPDATSLETNFSTPKLRSMAADSLAGVEDRRYNSYLKSLMYADLTVKKLPKLLFFQDRASMAHGVEVRVPYLDHRLVEMMYRLPVNMLIRNGQTKFLPRLLMRDHFRKEIPRAVKHYVATPQREWMKDVLYTEIRTLLKDGLLLQSGLVDADAFLKAYESYHQQADLGNSFFVWKFINLELLMRRFCK